MPWIREENILFYSLFGGKIFQNCPKIDDSLLGQDTQKRLHVLEADVIAIKKTLIRCI